MEFKEIQDLLKLVNKTDLTEVEIEKDDFKLKIRRQPPEGNIMYTAVPQTSAALSAIPPSTVLSTRSNAEQAVESAGLVPQQEKNVPASEPKKDLFEFKSPMIGTFYRSSTPDSDPFVKVGDHIEKGEVICIVEAMKLFNEIESEVSGKVVKIMIENAQPIEYDQVLFLIDTNG